MNAQSVLKIVVFSLILSLLLYPGLEKLYLYKQTNELEDLVMAPLGFLAEDQTILSNDDKFTRYGTKYKSLDLLPNRDLFIGIKNEFLFHEKWVNISEEKNRVNVERWLSLAKFRKNIAENAHSLLVYGPDTTELDLYYVIKNESKVVDNYCSIILPTTEHKCTLCKYAIRTFFRENESCNYLMQKMLDYYGDNFYKICRADEITANFQVRTIIAQNGFYAPEKCSNGGTLLMDYNDKNIRLNYLLNILYFSLLVAVVILFKFKRRQILYSLGILMILLLPLSIFNNNFVSDYALNESSYIYTQKSILDNENLTQDLKKHKTIHDASYQQPAVIYGLSQKNFFPVGRYLNDPNQG